MRPPQDDSHTQYVSLDENENEDKDNDAEPHTANTMVIDTKPVRYTKYDFFALFLLILTALFCLSWIGYICYQFVQSGVTNAYCPESYAPCTLGSYWSATCCDDFTDYRNYCRSSESDIHCAHTKKTVIPFIVQLLLILFIIFQIYLLLASSKKGIQILDDDTPSNPSKPQQLKLRLTAFKQKVDSKKINCRRCAYTEKETPQQTARNFILNSLIILSLLTFLKKLPIVILNIATGHTALSVTGYLMLSSAAANIVQALYAKFCCCCNPCQGRCCCNNDCCCDCCCRLLACKCCCDSHFPPHHRPYVDAVASVINYSNYLNYMSGTVQMLAITRLASEDGTSLWNLFLVCLNFVGGLNTIIGVLRIYWRYFYVCCYYWTRSAVNKHESYKIHDLLNDLLQNAYVFVIRVEKEDEFITVKDEEEIAERVKLKCDCFTVGLIFNLVGLYAAIYFLVKQGTDALNADFTTQYFVF